MFNKFKISPHIIIYVVLTILILAVFWQVTQFDFDCINGTANYLFGNHHVQSGITLDGIRWAFSTSYADFWHPLTWISLMLDYELFGLNAGGYHLTNVILHILNTLLLFWLFNRMTGAFWKSAFVAAFFALHPLHVESVAWINKRHDLLSTFLGLLTLCLYVYYTEKPFIKRYLLVIFFFALALMTKPMVVTLPVIMILLDYWPLGRFESKKVNLILWQLKEKIPLFILSAVLSIISIYVRYNPDIHHYTLASRIANAPISLVLYLDKTFWPHDLGFYPFSGQPPVWQIIGAVSLLTFISIAVIVMMKRLPYLFVGWLWYVITLMPVIGIVLGNEITVRADHFTYLPSIGIAIVLAWGIPLLFRRENAQKKILFPMAVVVLAILAVLSWQQCHYWKNKVSFLSYFLQMTKDNYLMNNRLDLVLSDEEKIHKAMHHYNKAIQMRPDYANAYNNRGTIYIKLGNTQLAIEDFNQAIRLRPDYVNAYINRGLSNFLMDGQGMFPLCLDFTKACALGNCKWLDNMKGKGFCRGRKAEQEKFCLDARKACVSGDCTMLEFARGHGICTGPDKEPIYNNRRINYTKQDQQKIAVDDFYQDIHLKPNNAYDFHNRGINFSKRGKYKTAIEDFNQAIRLKPDFVDAYNNRGLTYFRDGQNQPAIDDFNRAILLKPDLVSAFINRGAAYFISNKEEPGCLDAQKACSLGNCELLKMAKAKGYCR
jgi:tetratricopeptide (TPR) repeat protein